MKEARVRNQISRFRHVRIRAIYQASSRAVISKQNQTLL